VRWLERFERSELSLRVFCRRHRVPVSTLLFWRRRARQTAAAAAEVLVEVPSAAVSGAAATTGARGIAIRLPNHIELEVSDQTDPRWVAALVREALACSG
jgi:hypothetical protein